MTRTTDGNVDTEQTKTTVVPTPTQHEASPISTEPIPSSAEETLDTKKNTVLTVTKTVKTTYIEKSVENEVVTLVYLALYPS